MVSTADMIMQRSAHARDFAESYVAEDDVLGVARAMSTEVGVTAISARDAWAVGQGNGQILIVHWNGSAWRQQAS